MREGSYVVLLHGRDQHDDAALLSLLATAVYTVSTLPGAVAIIHRPVAAAPFEGGTSSEHAQPADDATLT